MTTQTYQKANSHQIKQALVSEFKHPFSVRKGRGTTSHWYNVSWTDGPTTKQVDEVLALFKDTANDDIVTDLWCGSQYTSSHRQLSDKYNWMMVGKLDLRDKPAIEDQLYNYWNLISSRFTGARYTITKYSDRIEIEKKCNGGFDSIEFVGESLTAQGFKHEFDGKTLVVYFA